MLPRFFQRITGNETGKRTFSPKSIDFRILESMLQDPCGIPICLPLDFLKAITCDFSEEQELGRGGFGVVYKGNLQNGMTIAVKKLSEMLLEDAQFHKEVTYLIGVEHQNIVELIGYCAESRWEATQVSGKYVMAEIRKRLLCFEYLNNKSLDKHLFAESCGLKWNTIYEIINGICCGLHYLHTECHIAHLDLKPENILLDDNMVPKIADFGMSRLFGQQQSRIITESRGGTRGYMAPEYITNGLISTKSDIFSLGVIIIELMTGSRGYPESKQSFEKFIENVVENWRKNMEKSPSCVPIETKSQQVNTCISIAFNCVDPDPDRRPSAWDIIQMLTNTVEKTTLESEIDRFSKTYSRMDLGRILNNTASTSITENISSLFTFSAKGNKISILSFEVASTIVKSFSMMNILSGQSMELLEKGVLRSEGVRRLISEDHNQLLILVEADIREEWMRLSTEVSRFGNLCTDPVWHNMYYYFESLPYGGASLKISNDRSIISNIQYLKKLEKYTSELHAELIMLDKYENRFRALFHQAEQSDLCDRDMILPIYRLLKHQRSVVRNLKKKSLWFKSMEDIVEKLVEIVCLLHVEIESAFVKKQLVQSVAPATDLRQPLGPTGLALHYANVILQINTLVLTRRAAVLDKMARDALYQALPPCIKSKLQDCCRREKTTTVAETRAEMNRILQWLVPIAESTSLYCKNGAFGEWKNMVEVDDIDVKELRWPEQEESKITAVGGALAMQRHVMMNKIETLYYADKERTEAYIAELIGRLNIISFANESCYG